MKLKVWSFLETSNMIFSMALLSLYIVTRKFFYSFTLPYICKNTGYVKQ